MMLPMPALQWRAPQRQADGEHRLDPEGQGLTERMDIKYHRLLLGITTLSIARMT